MNEIKIPTDEEIEKHMNDNNMHLKTWVLRMPEDRGRVNGFYEGAKWMRDKIKEDNKL